jgi:hypothetical protein
MFLGQKSHEDEQKQCSQRSKQKNHDGCDKYPGKESLPIALLPVREHVVVWRHGNQPLKYSREADAVPRFSS